MPDELLQEAERLLARREVTAAIAAFDYAENCGAEARRCAAGRWQAFMLAGEFAAAWQESDAIREKGLPDVHRFWNGEDPRGRRVLIRCLHGFGDSIQFLRFVPRLCRLAKSVTVEAAPYFLELAHCIEGVDRAIVWGEEPPPWDMQVEVTELPYLLRIGLEELPAAVGYLRLPERKAEIARGGGDRVGVVWEAGEWNRSRSIPLPLLAPALAQPGIQLCNLQGGTAAEEWHRFFGGPARIEGLVELAAAISRLDLVITVDTLAAHLAGALEVPAWVLLEYAADWRWMLEREDSPWYPSLRLFRQRSPGEWESVVREVERELARRGRSAA